MPTKIISTFDCVEEKIAQYSKVLNRYLPEAFIGMVVELLLSNNIQFKIVKPRKTKLGDFRTGISNDRPVITVNGNLNPYSFLITTLHEFAHLYTFQKHGRKVDPHGREWKNNFAQLLFPLIESKDLPEDIRKALTQSIYNIKASSCTDHQLQRVLMRYDKQEDGIITVEEVGKNGIFELNGQLFQKGLKRRTRYICTDKNTQRTYLVHSLAKVKEIKYEE